MPTTTDITPSVGLEVGDTITVSFTPKDASGNPVTGEAANVTITIWEPGVAAAIVKTDTDLTEVSGTYSYIHTTTVAGVGRGLASYAGSLPQEQSFYYDVDPNTSQA